MNPTLSNTLARGDAAAKRGPQSTPNSPAHRAGRIRPAFIAAVAGA